MSQPPNPQHTEGEALVVDRHGPVITVLFEDGERVPCLGHGKGKGAVVGDRVQVVPGTDEKMARMRIIDILPRANALVRANALNRRPQTVAANLDRLYIVVAIEPPLRLGLIDRYLITASQAGIEAHILFNKVDLLKTDEDLEMVGDALAGYPAIGVPVHFVCARTGHGLRELSDELRGHTSLLVGHSGVGKTSLLNALSPGLGEAVRALSESSGRGTHTTSRASLYHLEGDIRLIDSPGVRGIAPWGLQLEELKEHFPEFVERAPECRFLNCQHLEEPDCAVLEALGEGEIAESRYEAYTKIRASLSGDLGRFW